MTGGVFAGVISALWLGVLTSINPCPLATNIAAVSFIGRRVGNVPAVLLSGLLYTLGRVLMYLAVGMIVVYGLLAVPDVAMFLQKYMGRIIGPVLIVTGLFLLEIIRIGAPGGGIGEGFAKRAGEGPLGAMLLGMLFALSFCPVSAALFFGSLIPLSVEAKSTVLLPALYGVGTGLPVLLFAVLLAVSAHTVGAAFRMLSKIERWVRWITGIVFILTGIYLAAKNIFGLPLPF